MNLPAIESESPAEHGLQFRDIAIEGRSPVERRLQPNAIQFEMLKLECLYSDAL